MNPFFQTFNPKLKIGNKKVIYLEWEELDKLSALEVSEHLTKVRDVFLFLCFTGLRYSDVANLKRSDVFGTYISVTTIKTAQSIKIELNDISKAILEKYKNETYPNDRALPVISNTQMNIAVKEVCKAAGIDTPITITYYKGGERFEEVHPKYELMGTHAGRRTFICNAFMLGIPLRKLL